MQMKYSYANQFLGLNGSENFNVLLGGTVCPFKSNVKAFCSLDFEWTYQCCPFVHIFWQYIDIIIIIAFSRISFWLLN